MQPSFKKHVLKNVLTKHVNNRVFVLADKQYLCYGQNKTNWLGSLVISNIICNCDFSLSKISSVPLLSFTLLCVLHSLCASLALHLIVTL